MLPMCKQEHEVEWLIDRVCSLHMIGRLQYLCDFRPISGGRHITFGNNAYGIIWGYLLLTMGSFSIRQVAYVDGLKRNLISVGQLCNVGHRVEFGNEYCYIMTSDRNKCLIKSKVEGTIYPLDVSLIIGKLQLFSCQKQYLR